MSNYDCYVVSKDEYLSNNLEQPLYKTTAKPQHRTKRPFSKMTTNSQQTNTLVFVQI